MLNLVNTINCNVAHPAGFVTNFLDQHYVVAGDTVIHLNPEDHEIGRDALNGMPLRSIWWAAGCCHVLTSSALYWWSGQGSLRAIPVKTTEYVSRWGGEIAICKRVLGGYRLRIVDNSGQEIVGQRIWKLFAGKITSICFVRGECWVVLLCDSSRRVHLISAIESGADKFPDRISHVAIRNHEFICLGHNARHLWACDPDLTRLYAKELPFRISGIAASRRGSVAVWGHNDCFLVNESGTTVGKVRTRNRLVGGQISSCGKMLAIMTEDGALYVYHAPNLEDKSESESDDSLSRISSDDSNQQMDNPLRAAVRSVQARESAVKVREETIQQARQQVQDRQRQVQALASVVEQERECQSADKKALNEQKQRQERKTRQLIRVRQKLLDVNYLQRRLERQHRRSSDDQIQADRLIEQSRRLLSAIQEAQSKLNKAEAELNRQKDEFARVRKETVETHGHLNSQTSRLCEAQQELAQIKRDVECVEAKHDATLQELATTRTRKATLEAQVTETESQLQLLTEKIDELHHVLSTLQEREQELSHELSSIEKMHAHVRDIEGQLMDAQRQAQELSTRREQIRVTFDATQTEIESVRKSIADNQMNIETLTVTKTNLENEHNSLAARLASLEEVAETFEVKRSAIQELSQKCEQIQTEASELSVTDNDLREQFAKYAAQCTDLREHIASTESALRKEQATQKSLESQQVQLTPNLEVLAADNASLEQTVERLTAHQRHRQEICDQLETSVQGLKEQLQALTAAQDDHRNQAQQLTDAIATITEENKGLEEELAAKPALLEELNARKASLSEDYKDMQRIKEETTKTSQRQANNQKVYGLASKLLSAIQEGES